MKRRVVKDATLVVRMESRLRREIAAAARADGRTASGWVVKVLAGAVAESEAEAARGDGAG